MPPSPNKLYGWVIEGRAPDVLYETPTGGEVALSCVTSEPDRALIEKTFGEGVTARASCIGEVGSFIRRLRPAEWGKFVSEQVEAHLRLSEEVRSSDA